MTTPAVVLALLVILLAVALILDRLWLEAARLELHTAAEAAALAAARELGSDDRLRTTLSVDRSIGRAVQAAIVVAQENHVAGAPVIIEDRDVTFPDQPAIEVESRHGVSSDPRQTIPSTVVVTAHRSRFRGNPVALWISGLTGQPFGDAVGQAAASIAGPIHGVRPLEGSAVPAVPLAIWRRDPTGQRKDTWQAAIELRQGRDDYGYDELRQEVTTGADGIPELTLTTAPRSGPVEKANLQLVNIGSDFQDAILKRQFEIGWTPADLEAWGGQLLLNPFSDSSEVAPSSATARNPSGQATPQQTTPAFHTVAHSSTGILLQGLPFLESGDSDELSQLIGIPRIALLYSSASAVKSEVWQDVDCVQLVAIRLLKVAPQTDGSCQIIVQPTIVTTRTALVSGQEISVKPSDGWKTAEPTGTPPIQYIYRLQLTGSPLPAGNVQDEIAVAGDIDRS